MQTEFSNPNHEARVSELIDDRLFQAYWDACEHFGTTDLVVFYDEDVEYDPVITHSRINLINDPNLPDSLLAIINKPAIDAKSQLASSDAAFWFIVYFRNGEASHMALKAKVIGPSGNA
jgi:acyl-CoA thioesterase